MKNWLIAAFLVVSLPFLHSCGTNSYLDGRLKTPALFSIPAAVPVTDKEHFSFAVVGDLHIGRQITTRLDTILTEAKNEGDDFLVLLGDIIDKGVEADFVAVTNSVKNAGMEGRVFYVVGNHDVFDSGWDHYQRYFGPNRYTFKAGNSQFLVIDTADGTVGTEQFNWIRSQMNGAPANTFIASHYLPVVPSQQTYLKLSNTREALRLMKMASDLGVRGWLGGHYHSFLTGRVGNVDYVVAGGGGGRRMPPLTEFFFAQVKVDGTNISYNLHVVP
ncbi:MAG: metallophosphoesterase [Deltaproteobacteria bacterium]|nr:metallophosphoesterase [Deltaproteobacteria bacterium]